ncbi:MAG: YggS family pyridoxal phosphate-dependent enzyme [Pseudomonadales bacterium]|nr:YggS family pyridoxal phosphate-dependent enzyme [Pseudomonadales bacterium]
MKSIAENIQNVVKDIEGYERLYERGHGSVALLGASKTQSVEAIIQAYQAGVRHFGENYLQEALEKQPLLAQASVQDITWHYIGPIQSRKARDIAEHFDWVHSVDRLKVAQKLSSHRGIDKAPLQVCIQVNISDDPDKSGVTVEQIVPLAQQIQALPGLELRGLMTLPRAEQTLPAQRVLFKLLAQQFKQLQQQMPQIDTLSMGMSQDMEAAIAEGATFVRIGTGIFGSRKPKTN